MELASCHPPGD